MHAPGSELVGLTSPAERPFVRSLERRTHMPHTYFEADGLDGLQRIYDRAIEHIGKRQIITMDLRNIVAARIFTLAADGGHSDEDVLKAALKNLIPDGVLDDIFSPQADT